MISINFISQEKVRFCKSGHNILLIILFFFVRVGLITTNAPSIDTKYKLLLIKMFGKFPRMWYYN